MALTFSVLAVPVEAPQHDDQGLSMQLDTELVFEKMVKIYNYEGSLVREFPLTEVANNEISVIDNMILEDSDFAFDYQGDYYYFADSEYVEAVIN